MRPSVSWCGYVQSTIYSTTAMERFTVVRRLADALYGDVLLCSCNATNSLVVIKRVRLTSATSKTTWADSTPIHEDAFLECHVGKVFGQRHPNVLGLFDEFETDHVLYMVMEYCSQGDLLDRSMSDQG